jgi:putrescine transport system substrate-binding protein
MNPFKLGIATALTLALGQTALAQDNVLNIYNWSDYIDPTDVKKFEKETGVKVNYDVYDSNEMLEAKLMAGNSGYDLVVPTGAFLERQLQAGVYAKIDKTKLKNYKNIDAELAKKTARSDKENAHNVAYAWGTVGLGYNLDMLQSRLGKDMPFDTLDLIFKPELSAKLKGCGIALLDAPADMLSVAMNYLGLDPNSEKKADLKKATQLLKDNRQNYKYFHSSQYISDLANGDVCLALGYNGDILQSQSRAEEAGQGVKVGYSIPKEGTQVWFDLMAIPADAPNKENAYKFIDFVLRGETAANIANYVYYAVPNTAATPFIEKAVLDNPGIYPTDAVKAKLFPQLAHTAKFDRLLSRAWTGIKTGR